MAGPDGTRAPGGAATELRALPAQPPGVAWPTAAWPTGPAPPGVQAAVDAAFEPGGPLAVTYAVVVVTGGRLRAERYGGALEHLDRPPEPVGADTALLSWSVAKSVLHAAVGLLVADGRLDPSAPAPVPAWQAPGDPRRAVTLDHLLAMRDGLDFTEDYVDERVSDTIEMLFGSGRHDVAGYAAAKALAAAPGTRFSYSSGTSNIVAAVVGRAAGEPVDAFLARRLFAPLGMTSARPTLDAAGTWVASSFLHATARDYARFGLLYLRDGMWEGARLLPAGWVDHGRRQRSVDEEGLGYGAHWWVAGDRHGTFSANGYEGQTVVVCPALDTVVVRLGKTPDEEAAAVRRWRAAVLDAVAAG